MDPTITNYTSPFILLFRQNCPQNIEISPALSQCYSDKISSTYRSCSLMYQSDEDNSKIFDTVLVISVNLFTATYDFNFIKKVVYVHNLFEDIHKLNFNSN